MASPDLVDIYGWRGFVNHMIYGAPLADLPSMAMAQRLSLELIRQRHFVYPPEVYYRAASAALASGEAIATLDDRQNETAVRALLAQTLEELDKRRPWPAPPYVYVNNPEWDEYRNLPTVGTIKVSRARLESLLGRPFDDSFEPTTDIGAILIRLRSGDLTLFTARSGDSSVCVRATGNPSGELRSALGLDIR